MAHAPSPQQSAIFQWFAQGKGNLVVRARAGTGKTTTILEGINHAPERRILLAAFNKRIALELTQRLANPRAEAKTLHGVGFGCIVRNWQGTQINEDRGYGLARECVTDDVPDEIVGLIKKLASRCKGTCPFPTLEDVIAEAQDADIMPEADHEKNGWDVKYLAGRTMAAMDLACRRDGTIDFDDMIFVALRNKWVFGRFDLVVIDEAQDMNAAQLMLAQLSCKAGGRIAVVGDDRQAIYGFRGADSNSVDRLKAALKATELGLTVTYRCPKAVVAAAQELVPDFMAAPTAPTGSVTRMVRDAMLDAAAPGDFILSRKNAPLIGTCMALLRRGKRAKVEGRDVGRGLIALVKKLAAKSIPDFLLALGEWRERENARADALPETRRANKRENIADTAETLTVLTEGLTAVPELLARVQSLFADIGADGASVIVCSSVHKAKGLERDTVYLLEDTFAKPGAGREEMNIRYVAITRSKNALVWVTDPNRVPTPAH